jgi:hypothetical protein
MRFTLLLGSVLMCATAAAAQDLPSLEAAAQLEAAGRYQEALAAYQRVAAARPADHAARLSTARMHERLGYHARAEAVFRSVMLEDASNVPAMLGVARSVIAQLRPEDAIPVLERAEQVAPENADVLTLLGRAHADAAHGLRADTYYQRAAAASESRHLRMLLERTRRAERTSLELRTFAEDADAAPKSRHTELTLDYRASDRLRVRARGQVQKKFSKNDGRVGVGLHWRATPTATIMTQALVGPDNVIMPTGDYMGGVAYSYRTTTWLGSVRYFDFQGLQMTTLSPSFSWTLEDRLSFGAGYALSLSEGATLAGTVKNHSTHVRGGYQFVPRVTLTLGYARGVEDFEHLSLDRTGDFRANTLSTGVRVDLPSLTSVLAGYERQWRADDTEMQRMTVSLAQRF